MLGHGESQTETAVEALESAGQHRRKQLRLEFVYHLFVLIVCLTILILSFQMTVRGQEFVFFPGAILPMPPSCSAQALLGISCPGCGLTRAFISISHGEWAKAWQFNAASFLVYLFVLAQIPWRGFQIWRILMNRFPVFSPWLFLPLFTCAGLLVIQWMLKMLGFEIA